MRVIVVNYNGGDWLPRCIDALLAQTFSDFEAVVVDNASQDDSLAALPSDPRLRILRLDDNLGFAAGNNRGAEGFRGEWIATLNPDAIAAPDWLERLLDATRAHPDVQAFGSTQLDAAAPGRYDGTGDGLSIWGLAWRGDIGRPVDGPHPDGAVFAPCAAAALYRRDWFEQLGGFDERLFCYLEDIDLALRLRAAGGRCRQVGNAVVRHAGSALTGGEFSLYHIYRNQLWLLARHWPLPLLAVALPGHLAWISLMAAHFARQGRLEPVARGLRDGLAGLPDVWRNRYPVKGIALARQLHWNPLRLVRRDCPVIPD